MLSKAWHGNGSDFENNQYNMSEKVLDTGIAERGIDDDSKHLGIPGTVRLVDAEHEFSLSETGDVILVPQPTSDPEDPLNWKPWRKRRAIWLSHLYVVATTLPHQADNGPCTASPSLLHGHPRPSTRSSSPSRRAQA